MTCDSSALMSSCWASRAAKPVAAALLRWAALWGVCLVGACTPSVGRQTGGLVNTPATAASASVPSVPAASPAPAAQHPALLLDLTEWKVQLPVNAAGETAGRHGVHSEVTTAV